MVLLPKLVVSFKLTTSFGYKILFINQIKNSPQLHIWSFSFAGKAGIA